MADIKALEHPTLKVPYEILNKTFRNSQRIMEREISQIQQFSNVEYEKSSDDWTIVAASGASAASTTPNRSTVSDFLGSMVYFFF